MSRREANAVVTDEDAVVRRALAFGVDGAIEAVDGTTVTVAARSLCVHGDTPARPAWPPGCARHWRRPGSRSGRSHDGRPASGRAPRRAPCAARGTAGRRAHRRPPRRTAAAARGGHPAAGRGDRAGSPDRTPRRREGPGGVGPAAHAAGTCRPGPRTTGNSWRSPCATTDPTWPTWPPGGASAPTRSPPGTPRTPTASPSAASLPGSATSPACPRNCTYRAATRPAPGSRPGAGPRGSLQRRVPARHPGGWQLIGTMPDPAPLWDLTREQCALLTPGTRVRFVPEGGTGAVRHDPQAHRRTLRRPDHGAGRGPTRPRPPGSSALRRPGRARDATRQPPARQRPRRRRPGDHPDRLRRAARPRRHRRGRRCALPGDGRRPARAVGSAGTGARGRGPGRGPGDRGRALVRGRRRRHRGRTGPRQPLHGPPLGLGPSPLRDGDVLPVGDPGRETALPGAAPW